MSFGGTIKLKGEKEYKDALKDITSSLKLVSSELKLANVEFANGDKSIKQTKSSYNDMNETVQEQKEKITSLREALKDAEKEYGSNNVQIKTFRSQLNNAENKLIEVEDATDKSTKELKEMKEGFDDAGNGALKFGDVLKANILSDAIVGGIKAIGSAVKSMGSALLDVGKQALDSYADYEQLTGGVETLFALSEKEIEDYAKVYGKSVEEVKADNELMRSSMNEVFGYANEAYKTAGLSANEYMETVTSFSASLLQSLNGNSFEAAEYANRAIIDMSDNANKMGTDMSMIQSAYQGFAKQNYTMLDNLKLGYGGTKTEMERLIEDANQIKKTNGEMADLSIASFADIIEAIHVVQTEMDITGTTAKEASTTISGSLSSVKSAWQNMLTSIASGNGESFKQTLNLLVESILTFADNVIPIVENIIDGIADLIVGLADKILEYMPEILQVGMNLLQKLLDGMTSMIPQLMPVVFQIIDSLASFVTDNLPTILETGITILVELVRGIAQSLPDLIPAIVNAIMLIVDTIIDNIDLLIDAGIEIILALVEGIIEAVPTLIEKIPTIIQKLINAIIENFPKLIQAGGQIIGKLVVGLIGSLGELLVQAPKIITTLVKGISNGFAEIKNIGKNLVSGIWEGISGSLDWIKNKITGWVGSVTKFIKKLFGINSPSKLFKDEIGNNLALGIGEGFSDTMSDVSNVMADSIPTEFDTNINTNYDAISNGNNSLNYDNLVEAFKQALKDTKVVMNNREMGNFIVDTVGSAIYG